MTRSGYVAANGIATGVPSAVANMAARSYPAPSITALMSSILCSSVGLSQAGTPSDMPEPRLSNSSSRLNDAIRRQWRASAGFVPSGFDVTHEARGIHDIGWPATDHLVSDVEAARSCVGSDGNIFHVDMLAMATWVIRSVPERRA